MSVFIATQTITVEILNLWTDFKVLADTIFRLFFKYGDAFAAF